MFAESIFYILISVTVCYAFYKWATINNNYFEKRNLKHLKPKFLFGNTIGLFMNRYRPADFVNSIYYRFPKEKCVQNSMKEFSEHDDVFVLFISISGWWDFSMSENRCILFVILAS